MGRIIARFFLLNKMTNRHEFERAIEVSESIENCRVLTVKNVTYLRNTYFDELCFFEATATECPSIEDFDQLTSTIF